jgi:hypothetical protein
MTSMKAVGTFPQALLAELPLQELRQARRMTQEALAKRLW